jgi:hypothetical protein
VQRGRSHHGWQDNLAESVLYLEAPWEVRVEALGRMKDLIVLLEREAKKYLDKLESKLVSATKK